MRASAIGVVIFGPATGICVLFVVALVAVDAGVAALATALDVVRRGFGAAATCTPGLGACGLK